MSSLVLIIMASFTLSTILQLLSFIVALIGLLVPGFHCIYRYTQRRHRPHHCCRCYCRPPGLGDTGTSIMVVTVSVLICCLALTMDNHSLSPSANPTSSHLYNHSPGGASNVGRPANTPFV